MAVVEPIALALLDARQAGETQACACADAGVDDTGEQIAQLARYLTHDGVFAPRVCAPQGSPPLKAARAFGVPVLELPAAPASGLTRWRALWRLHRAFAGGKPLLLHSFDPRGLALGRLLAATRRANLTARVHTALWLREYTSLTRLGKEWQGLARVACGSSLVCARLLELGLPRECMDIILPAADMAAMPPKATRADGRFVFMVLEPLTDDSGLEQLLEAVRVLIRLEAVRDLTPAPPTDISPVPGAPPALVDATPPLPRWEVRIVGQGPAFSRLLTDAKALGVDKFLSFLGAQNPCHVAPQADVILATALHPQGSWPAPVYAWGMGIPLLYNAVPGHRELARGRECGLMLPMEEPAVLAMHMLRCLQDAALRRHLAAVSATMRPHTGFARLQHEYAQAYARAATAQGWVIPQPEEVEPRALRGRHTPPNPDQVRS